MTAPAGALDARFSQPEEPATEWSAVQAALEDAEIFWVSSLQQDGELHVTPLIAVWSEGALHFCTGPTEQKARNLERHPQCALTTGTNAFSGLDVVVHGEAVPLTDDSALTSLAASYVRKYGEDWRFSVKDGAFDSEDGGRAVVFRVEPTTVMAFSKEPFTQTRFRFRDERPA
ncbi:pyridoxamine 5'-phosphate oxidase family protein [Nakamurella sp. YIM 132087]|uniref:Pyridoxamine 5'-phosphate oxidase family protein n=1 Tax=Nakamurella alba TaxID=2665158 RepID=A0A7K1FID8_9ACTN|nr:pyridoxamine 5'-phosphate oxidase family protein [Nakamurella alba]MTD12654.1 pyridoxamine 5'-phosphate oxidase family protein [Nakamurella alba]